MADKGNNHKNIKIRVQGTSRTSCIGIESGMVVCDEPDRTKVDFPRFTQRFDFVDGCSWTEVGECLPLTQNEYSCLPMSVFTSNPCKVITADGNMTYAVYVRALSIYPNNDGTSKKWTGWSEIQDWPSWSKTAKDERDWNFVENVLHSNTINVSRWHYYNDKDK